MNRSVFYSLLLMSFALQSCIFSVGTHGAIKHYNCACNKYEVDSLMKMISDLDTNIILIYNTDVSSLNRDGYNSFRIINPDNPYQPDYYQISFIGDSVRWKKDNNTSAFALISINGSYDDSFSIFSSYKNKKVNYFEKKIVSKLPLCN